MRSTMIRVALGFAAMIIALVAVNGIATSNRVFGNGTGSPHHGLTMPYLGF